MEADTDSTLPTLSKTSFTMDEVDEEMIQESWKLDNPLVKVALVESFDAVYLEAIIISKR